MRKTIHSRHFKASYGKTALDHAREANHENVIKRLAKEEAES